MKVVIAGGGTGGHLFPGIALAQEITTRHPQNDVLFVGTRRGLESVVVPREGYKLELIQVDGLKGVELLRLLRSLITIPLALWQSARILRRHRPDVVVGVGGYASGPVVLAAWLMRIPTCIQEQNALPGLTNRLLSHFAQAVFVAFEEARAALGSRKVRLLGNPIRRELMNNFLENRSVRPQLHLLIFGGSQGAHAVNTNVLAAMPLLADLHGKLAIVHQTGKQDVNQVGEAYAKLSLQAEVLEFIDDMSHAYSEADLVICRAGATTIAELTVCKKPAILIPFPHAADNHQVINARSMVQAGAAVMLQEADLTPAKLAQVIRELSSDRARLGRMERAAGLLGRPEAAKEIADVCVEMMEQRWGKHGRARLRASVEGLK